MSEQPKKGTKEPANEAQPERHRERSPSYPGIALERALGLARKIYEKEGRHETPAVAIWQHWGMKPKTGPALVAIGALKRFGLLEGKATALRLSRLALDIIQDEREDSTERTNRIREAALSPPIHKQLWEKYGGHIPSDANLKFMLMRELGFTDRGADELIQEFRRTISFARLGEPGLQSGNKDDKLNGEEGKQVAALTAEIQAPPPPPLGGSRPTMREIQIPISHDAWAVLKAPFPLTTEAWEQMEAVLKAMKPVLVEPKKDS
jgi:hypothetical protein